MKTNRRSVSGPALAVLALTLGACASPRQNAIFVTKTSLSVFDAESAPVGVSFAYDRVEGYAGPRFEDGSVFPVVGYLETDNSHFLRDVRQTYATGKAAALITKADDGKAGSVLSDSKADQPAGEKTDKAAATQERPPALFFATSTMVGLKIAFQPGNYGLDSFTFGYKRKEASVIPVEKGHSTSVFASIDTSGGVVDPLGTKAAGDSTTNPARFKLTQFFATGIAAEQIAASSAARTKMATNVQKATELLSK